MPLPDDRAHGGGCLAASRGGGRPHVRVTESGSRFARLAIRESAILAVAVVAAFLFDIHPSFYGGQPRTVGMPSWVLVLLVVVVYLLLRMLFLIGSMFYRAQEPELVLCPECGRLYDESRPEALQAHHRITLSPKPTEREILAAIMLRKAIDDARRSSTRNLAGPKVVVADLPSGDVENPPVPVAEFERILKDLDVANAPRRGPSGRRPRGPPEFPR